MMNDIIDVAAQGRQFSTFLAALTVTGLTKKLERAGPFTVFMPTDSAFVALPNGTLHTLLQDKGRLTALLMRHVVAGRRIALDVLRAGGTAPTAMDGSALDVSMRNDEVYVDGARVVHANVWASNGIIHVVDNVLLQMHEPVLTGH